MRFLPPGRGQKRGRRCPGAPARAEKRQRRVSRFGLQDGQQDEVQDEQDGSHPDDGMDLSRFLLTDLHDAVGNEAERDTIGNAVAQRHEQSCEERGNRFREVLPVDLLKGGGHHHANHNERRSGSRHGNRADKGGKEGADGKADGNHNAGQAGTAAGADAGSTFNIGGGVGGTEDGADGGGGGVSKESAVHLGLKAGVGLQGLLVLSADADTNLSEKGSVSLSFSLDEEKLDAYLGFSGMSRDELRSYAMDVLSYEMPIELISLAVGIDAVSASYSDMIRALDEADMLDILDFIGFVAIASDDARLSDTDPFTMCLIPQISVDGAVLDVDMAKLVKDCIRLMHLAENLQ